MVTHDNDQLYMNTSSGLGRPLSTGEIRFSVFIIKKLYFQDVKTVDAEIRKVLSVMMPAFKPTPLFPDDLCLSSDYVFHYMIFFFFSQLRVPFTLRKPWLSSLKHLWRKMAPLGMGTVTPREEPL